MLAISRLTVAIIHGQDLICHLTPLKELLFLTTRPYINMSLHYSPRKLLMSLFVVIVLCLVSFDICIIGADVGANFLSLSHCIYSMHM